MLTIFRTSKDRNQRPDEPDRNPVRQPQQTPPKPPQQNIPPKPQQNTPQPKQQPRPVTPRQSPPMAGATTIGKDLIFEGNVKGKGSIRVEGEFNGKLDVKNEVIIGEGGKVTGDVMAEVVTVEGNLKGNVTARQKININVTGTMIGDIIAPRVVVASGAVYKGRIDMETALKSKNETLKKDAAPAKKDTPKKDKPEEPKLEQEPKQDAPGKIPGPPPKN